MCLLMNALVHQDGQDLHVVKVSCVQLLRFNGTDLDLGVLAYGGSILVLYCASQPCAQRMTRGWIHMIPA